MRVRMLSLAFAVALLAACSTTPPDPVLDARVNQLAARADAAEAIRAVKRLQHSYGYYLGDGLWDDLGDLFTADATAEFGTVAVAGREAIQEHYMSDAGRTELGLAEGQLNLHLQLQPIVTLGADGVTAKGTWHEVAMLGQYGASAEWRGGIYENDYALEDGAWKISRIRFFQQYEGAYDEYGHHAPPAWNVPYHFEGAHVGVTIPAEALERVAEQERPVSTVDASMHAARLHSRARALADETAVANLQHAFGYYLDRKMYDDIADLFARGGTFEAANSGVYWGSERIRQALEALYGPTPLQTGELFDHINLQSVVTVIGDRAAARTTQIAQLGMNLQGARWEIGTYENEFYREDGVWKIAAIRYYPRLTTNYDLGWAVDAQTAPGVSSTFAPDRPSPVTFASYPDVDIVGFSYTNPATGAAVRYPDEMRVETPVIDAGERISMFHERAGRSAAERIAALSAGLDSTSRQLDAAIAVDAVENLMSSYGYYIDESDWNGMADTYSIDRGSKELTGVGVYVGRERIRTALNMRGPQGGRTPSFFTIHQLTQPVIHISEDGAYANARVRLFQMGGAADASSASWIGGIYENTAFFEDGEWKFGRQDLTHTFNASYRNGWARVGQAFRDRAAANPDATGRDALGGGITQGLGGARTGRSWSEDFPPDGAIRARQYSFPEIVTMAFHYRNPVSGREPPEYLP